MSNRKRREWMRLARMKEIVRAELADDLRQQLDALPEQVGDTRGAVRLVFARISRHPLRFRSNRQGSDSLGGSLINLQALNAPAGFDLLRGDLDELLIQAESCRLWSDYQDDLESVCSVFEQSREILAPLQRVNLLARDELQWTAIAHRAARSLSCHRSSIFQHASSLGSVIDSARDFWPELEPPLAWKWKSKSLADHEVYALLAMDEARHAAQSLVELIQRFDQWADDEGLSRDADDYEALRDEVSSWERREFRYVISQLAQAKDLQHLAHLDADSVKARKYAESLEREVIERGERLAAAELLAETGRRFEEGRAKGGQARKGVRVSVVKHAIERLCEKMGSYKPKEVFEEIRKDCDDDYEGMDGTSLSELMNDLRESAHDPVMVRFQEVPDDISDSDGVIRFRNLAKNVDGKIRVSAFRNNISKVKPA